MEGGKGRAAALAVFFLRNMLRCAWSLIALSGQSNRARVCPLSDNSEQK